MKKSYKLKGKKELFDLKLSFKQNRLLSCYSRAENQAEELFYLFYHDLYGVFDQDCGVWEGYSLKKHTLLVLKQYQKYYRGEKLPGNLAEWYFLVFLILHDIGKPVAIQNGGKHLQHRFTGKIMQKLMSDLAIPHNIINLFVNLVNSDPVGGYLRKKIDLKQAAGVVIEGAERSGRNVINYFKTLIIYYKVDAGSYTEDAGGIKSLDFLFDFNREKRILGFSAENEQRVNRLFKEINFLCKQPHVTKEH